MFTLSCLKQSNKNCFFCLLMDHNPELNYYALARCREYAKAFDFSDILVLYCGNKDRMINKYGLKSKRISNAQALRLLDYYKLKVDALGYPVDLQLRIISLKFNIVNAKDFYNMKIYDLDYLIWSRLFFLRSDFVPHNFKYKAIKPYISH